VNQCSEKVYWVDVFWNCNSFGTFCYVHDFDLAGGISGHLLKGKAIGLMFPFGEICID
jgi:hypothetical protein